MHHPRVPTPPPGQAERYSNPYARQCGSHDRLNSHECNLTLQYGADFSGYAVGGLPPDRGQFSNDQRRGGAPRGELALGVDGDANLCPGTKNFFMNCTASCEGEVTDAERLAQTGYELSRV